MASQAHDHNDNASAAMPTGKKNGVVFRFKFSENVVNKLNSFALLHKHEDRKDFKENWELWIKQNIDLIDEESQRLKQIGYKGDILDKMYKSVRYYFRNKSNSKTEPKQRRKYISINRELLAVIDQHIDENISNNTNFKPSDGYDEFYQIYEQRMVVPEIERIQKEYNMNKEDVISKIKKTYKNRYFIKIR